MDESVMQSNPMLTRRSMRVQAEAESNADKQKYTQTSVEAIKTSAGYRIFASFDQIDWILYAISFVFIVCISICLLRSTHIESHRLANVPSSYSSITLTRRSRLSPHTGPTRVSALEVDMQAASLQRRLLSLHTPSSPSSSSPSRPLGPFVSTEAMESYFRQWESELRSAIDKNDNVEVGLIEWLSPGVDRVAVKGAPHGSTNYCLTGFTDSEDPTFLFTLRHTFHMLDGSNTIDSPRWCVLLFVQPNVEPWIIRELRIGVGLPGEHIKVIRTTVKPNPDRTLPPSPLYYQSVPAEHIVHIQSGAFMLRSSHLSSSQAHEPDFYSMLHSSIYLGRPFHWCHHDWCRGIGNGPCSYRHKPSMMDFVRHIGCSQYRCEWIESITQDVANITTSDESLNLSQTEFGSMISSRRVKYMHRIASTDVNHRWMMDTSALTHTAEPFFLSMASNHNSSPPISNSILLRKLARVKQYYTDLWRTDDR